MLTENENRWDASLAAGRRRPVSALPRLYLAPSSLSIHSLPRNFPVKPQVLFWEITPASLRGVDGSCHPGMPFGFPPETAFDFAGILAEGAGYAEPS